MAIRTNPWIGAIGMGAVAAWLQKRQNEQKKSIFGNLLQSLGITSDAVGISLLVAASEAIEPVRQMIPPEYREGHTGAVDAALGIAAMYFAARQGLGALPTTTRQVITTAPVRSVLTQPLSAPVGGYSLGRPLATAGVGVAGRSVLEF